MKARGLGRDCPRAEVMSMRPLLISRSDAMQRTRTGRTGTLKSVTTKTSPGKCQVNLLRSGLHGNGRTDTLGSGPRNATIRSGEDGECRPRELRGRGLLRRLTPRSMRTPETSEEMLSNSMGKMPRRLRTMTSPGLPMPPVGGQRSSRKREVEGVVA